MLAFVASIIPSELPDRWRGSASGRELAASLAIPDDLAQATDDHTRALLERRPTSRRSQVVPRALILADILGLTVAYLLATRNWGGQSLHRSPRDLLLFVLSLPCWVLVAQLHGLYRRDEERTDHCTTDDIVGVFHLVTIAAWLLLVASRLAGRNGPGILSLTAFWLLAVLVIPIARTLARLLCMRTRAYEQNTVIVGAGDIGQLIARKLIKHPEYGANVVGFVDRFPKARRPDLPERLSILGGPERLPEIIECLEVERVVIALPDEPVTALLALLRQLRPSGVQIDLVPWLFELIGPRVSIHAVEGLPLIGLPPGRRSAASRVLKRAIDIVGASIALALLAPLMAYIALRVRHDSPGPVLFRQTRLGAGMKEFTAFKFRTMMANTDPAAHREYIRQTMSSTTGAEDNGIYKLNQVYAVTKSGQWLRKTSLDELPQLINVLRGDMSLVGPRPCIPYEAENYQPHHFERFQLPQGITGLWQVTARANSTYREALDLDVAYVRDWSLGLDLRLLLRTPLQVIRQRASTV
jgi:exopolysaccharide biosynthesis polyprenyl glycosylphosphotransferase